MNPRRATSRSAVRRIAVTTTAVLMLGLSVGTASALAAPARVQPSVATVTMPHAGPAQRTEVPAVSTAPLPAAVPAVAQPDPFWVTLWNLLLQFWARLFPPGPQAPPAQQLPLPYDGPANQVVTVDAPTPWSTTATVQAWNRSGDGWVAVTQPIPAMVGSQGIGQASEGTSRTPAGAYPLTQSFGRQPNPGTRLPYFQTGWWDWWNENSGSPGYNTHMVQPYSPGGNSENLYGAGPVYDYAANIDYNTAGVPGAGSAFFLHVTNGQPTDGCVAIPAVDLVNIMRWLDPGQHPAVVLGVP